MKVNLLTILSCFMLGILMTLFEVGYFDAAYWLLQSQLEKHFAPNLSYAEFESITCNKQTALESIEEVTYVDTNTGNNRLLITLKKDLKSYSVYNPESLTDFHRPIARLGACGIHVGLMYECL